MYTFNNDLQLMGLTAEKLQEHITNTDNNNVIINIGSYNISLNSFIINSFTFITNNNYYEVLQKLLNEVKTFSKMVEISEIISKEKVDEPYTDEIISGVVNYLMSEIMERLAMYPEYNGTLTNLLLEE